MESRIFSLKNADLKNTLVVLIVLKAIAGLVASFGYFSHPHIIRQVDTMGSSLNYFLRWQRGSDFTWLPGTLGGGATDGITTMEFPLLNILFAPVFSLGHEYGFVLCNILIILLSFFIAFTCYKYSKSISNEFKIASLLILITGVSSIYATRFMPDFISFSLVQLACLLNYNKNNKIIGAVLLSLGLLMKPTSAIALGLLLLRPFKLLKKDISWILIGLIVAVFYYTFGLLYIEQFSEIRGYYKVQAKSPLEGLVEFFMGIGKLPRLFSKILFPGLIFYIALPLLVINYKDLKLVRLLLILFLQIIAIAMIDGSHSYSHDYYFVGTSFITALILFRLYDKTNQKLQIVIIILLSVFTIERSFYRLKPLFKGSIRQEAQLLLHEVIDLADQRSINTLRGVPPTMGLALGIFQGKDLFAKYSIYEKDKLGPCHQRMRETKNLVLCLNKKLLPRKSH